MEFRLRYEEDGWIEEVYKAKGKELPKWLRDKPKEYPWTGEILNDFSRLSTTRNVGMGFGPIPFDRIRSYAVEIKKIIHEDDISEFYYYINSLDKVFIDHMRKKMKDKDK